MVIPSKVPLSQLFHGGCNPIPIADVLISSVTLACVTGPAQHPSLHYRHAESVVIGSRPALGTVRGNWANMTRDFGIETFVDMSITKDASCGARLVQVELRRETIKRRNSQLVDTIDPRYSKSQTSRQATVTDNGRACFIRFG